MTMEDAEARLEIRQLVESYALAVDSKDTKAVASLFSRDGRLVSLFGPGSVERPLVRSGREEIEAALVMGLGIYQSTTHIVGAHRAEPLGETANGTTSCLAHHVYEQSGTMRLLVLAVRYDDSYVVEDGAWRFAERTLSVAWRRDDVLETGTQK
jgi:uncharacterized protein (TIGR02246 family)